MKNELVRLPTQKSWMEAIAERASCDIEDVRMFIKKYNIIQTPLAGSPRRMNIQKVYFSGTKRGLLTNDFEFTFSGLGPGLWGLFTNGNGKGKTTALEVIKWLFKGKVPSTLQEGVKNWIKSASLLFHIDGVEYRISLSQNEDNLSGAIERFNNDSSLRIVAEFNGETEMAEEISKFMLEQFQLQEIASHRKGQDEYESGVEVIHGWPALAAAMFIGTDYAAIFGDVPNAGLPGRILNMFMGLPWIPTAAALKALDGNLKEEAAIEVKRLDWVELEKKDRLKEIKDELEDLRNRRIGIPNPATNEDEFRQMLDEYNRAYYNQQSAERELLQSRSFYDQISSVAKEDELRLRNFMEDNAANKVFKRINPKCCPHCDRKITTQDLKREQKDNTCSVCDHEMLVSDDSEDMLAELQDSVRLSKKAFDQQKLETKDRARVYHAYEKSCDKLNREANEYRVRLAKDREAIDQISKLEKEIYRLEVLEAEYVKPKKAKAVIDSIAPGLDLEKRILQIDETKILKAAIKETESRYKGLQDELFIDVAAKMLEYCSKVGLSQYKSLIINGTPTLKIDKDGLLTSYSKVSPGEKLRLKVIALLALISVAEQKGYGRHPGFLIIDSPAAQEVNEDDLHELMVGLSELCDILPSLQVIIASKATSTLLDLIDKDHRKYVEGKEYLW